MNTAEAIAQRDAYNWAGWCVDDDDTPIRPSGEPDPMASAWPPAYGSYLPGFSSGPRKPVFSVDNSPRRANTATM